MKTSIIPKRATVTSTISAGWLLKSCPKCGGDLYFNIELDDEYMQCLQCAYGGDAPGEIRGAAYQRIQRYRKFLSQLVDFRRRHRSRIRQRRRKLYKQCLRKQPNPPQIP